MAGFFVACSVVLKTHGLSAAKNQSRCGSLMATLHEFKALRDGVSMEVQGELFKLMTSDPDASIRRMVEIAAEKGMTVTADEVSGFLRQMDDDDEFDDFELDAVALLAIAGRLAPRGEPLAQTR